MIGLTDLPSRFQHILETICSHMSLEDISALLKALNIEEDTLSKEYDFTGYLGKRKVQMLWQGQFKLTKCELAEELKSSHEVLNFLNCRQTGQIFAVFKDSAYPFNVHIQLVRDNMLIGRDIAGDFPPELDQLIRRDHFMYNRFGPRLTKDYLVLSFTKCEENGNSPRSFHYINVVITRKEQDGHFPVKYFTQQAVCSEACPNSAERFPRPCELRKLVLEGHNFTSVIMASKTSASGHRQSFLTAYQAKLDQSDNEYKITLWELAIAQDYCYAEWSVGEGKYGVYRETTNSKVLKIVRLRDGAVSTFRVPRDFCPEVEQRYDCISVIGEHLAMWAYDNPVATSDEVMKFALVDLKNASIVCTKEIFSTNVRDQLQTLQNGTDKISWLYFASSFYGKDAQMYFVKLHGCNAGSVVEITLKNSVGCSSDLRYLAICSIQCVSEKRMFIFVEDLGNRCLAFFAELDGNGNARIGSPHTMAKRYHGLTNHFLFEGAKTLHYIDDQHN